MLLRRRQKISVHYVQVFWVYVWFAFGISSILASVYRSFSFSFSKVHFLESQIHIHRVNRFLDMFMYFASMQILFLLLLQVDLCLKTVYLMNGELIPHFFFQILILSRRERYRSKYWKIAALQGFFLPSCYKRLHCEGMLFYLVLYLNFPMEFRYMSSHCGWTWLSSGFHYPCLCCRIHRADGHNFFSCDIVLRLYLQCCLLLLLSCTSL